LRATIAANVRRLREERGQSQDELAAAVGISRVHLNRVENGKMTPGADLLYSLADALRVPADALRQLAERGQKNLVRSA
jgi:transcriptional regulator with XRE-family HTH domain